MPLLTTQTISAYRALKPRGALFDAFDETQKSWEDTTDEENEFTNYLSNSNDSGNNARESLLPFGFLKMTTPPLLKPISKLQNRHTVFYISVVKLLNKTTKSIIWRYKLKL